MQRFLFLFFLLPSLLLGQSPDQYFEKIRHQTVSLRAFFSQMPKGGDLHHHLAGSIYAEPILERAIKEDFWVNTRTYGVSPTPGIGPKWVKFSTLTKQNRLTETKINILKRWSIKDYDPSDHPSDKLFFESFDKFWPAVDGYIKESMIEIRDRAIKEKVNYIETQFLPVEVDIDIEDLRQQNGSLREIALQRDSKKCQQILEGMYNQLLERGAVEKVKTFNQNTVQKLHKEAEIDSKDFVMRYQNFVFRFLAPADAFKSTVLAFLSSELSPLVVGVNILAPEDGETSMKDYWLHMQMFKFCKEKFPAVKTSMHAGELTLGLVPPEELTWHIDEAVRVAGANRIGHGVDIPYEKDTYGLMRYMMKNNIAVEINLSSNEFILKVKEDAHPFLLYREMGVPTVIATDDAGVLRTNLTEQYVLLAKRYPSLSYSDIKHLVYNSITYSFIKEEDVRKQILTKMKMEFEKFEASLPR
ncbi:MAG: adenosine deaminase [Bacteroidota bacterium]